MGGSYHHLFCRVWFSIEIYLWYFSRYFNLPGVRLSLSFEIQEPVSTDFGNVFFVVFAIEYPVFYPLQEFFLVPSGISDISNKIVIIEVMLKFGQSTVCHSAGMSSIWHLAYCLDHIGRDLD